jgi:hypothetical protein
LCHRSSSREFSKVLATLTNAVSMHV